MIDVPFRIALRVAQMGRNQWKSRDELEEMQQEKLRSLLFYASEHVPHYKYIKNQRDLEDLPFITKKHLRDPGPFISSQHKREFLYPLRTSGSTGTPLTTYCTPREWYYRTSLYCSRLIEAGLRPLDYSVRVLCRPMNSFYWFPGLFRGEYLSMFDDEMKILSSLKRIGPDAVVSYPSTLILLAYKNMASGTDFKVGKVFSNAEALSKRARKLISRSFGCGLRDTYGAVETGPIAWECEKGSMHLHSDSIIAEVLDDTGAPVKQGKHGNIVLTPLWIRSMPLIRYNLGDRVRLGSKCRCGRGSHVIEDIMGRSDDFVIMQSGKAFALPLDSYMRYQEIILFRAIQERPGQLCINVVPRKGLSKGLQKRIVTEIQSLFPEPMDIEIAVVDELPRDRSGKLRSVISRVNPDLGG